MWTRLFVRFVGRGGPATGGGASLAARLLSCLAVGWKGSGRPDLNRMDRMGRIAGPEPVYRVDLVCSRSAGAGWVDDVDGVERVEMKDSAPGEDGKV
jgi:hypothetical protein